jgi:hypothetical protein
MVVTTTISPFLFLIRHPSADLYQLSEVWNRSPTGSIDIAAVWIDVDPSRKYSFQARKPFEPAQTHAGLSQTR